MIITLQHARKLKYCNRGIRAFCARHEIDFNRFRKDGIPVDELENIDDAMLRAVIKEAYKDVK